MITFCIEVYELGYVIIVYSRTSNHLGPELISGYDPSETVWNHELFERFALTWVGKAHVALQCSSSNLCSELIISFLSSKPTPESCDFCSYKIKNATVVVIIRLSRGPARIITRDENLASLESTLYDALWCAFHVYFSSSRSGQDYS